jgi:diaminopimelate epimerase
MKIKFTKMCAGGNDFIIIDHRRRIPQLTQPLTIQQLCRRKQGVGANGVILLETTPKGNFKMRIFNPDGQEVEMCGNGARCLVRWADEKKLIQKKMTFKIKAGSLYGEIKNKLVKLKMPPPRQITPEITLSLEKTKREIKGSFINTGVPHTVFFVNRIEKVPVVKLGREIRFHSRFQPAGTNVNFVEVKDKGTIAIRTYERGVEDETLACGTGVVAAALIFNALKSVPSPVQVITRGGDVLKVYFKKAKQKYTRVFLEGPAEIVYEGVIEI